MEALEYEKMRALEERHWWFLARRRIIANVLGRLLEGKERARLLDFGCGCGGNTAFFASQPNLEVVGVDINERAIEFCRERGLANVELIPMEGWEPEPEAFDAVVALDVLEHIEDHVGVLRTLWKGVKPGGFVLATVPAFMSLWSGHDVSLHHFRRYTKHTLDDLARDAGLGSWTHRGYFNFFLFPPVAAIRFGRKLFPLPDKADEARSDTSAVPAAPINRTLEALFAAERHAIGRAPFPFGVSLIAWARKPEEGS
jgi:SAM-dependent methyltransferase